MYTRENLASAWGAGVEERKLGRFPLAVLCSLVLHALLLLLLAYFREHRPVRTPLPPLTAHLTKPAPAPARPALEPLPPIPAARPAPVARAAAQWPAPVPVPAAPVLSIEPATQAAPSAPSAPTVPAAAPVPAPAPPAVAARAETQSVASAASGPDPGSVARFRLELMEIARRYKRYPRLAQDNSWEGRVELRIAFAESGAISSLTVKKGSGRAVLDDEAQAMIRSAQAQAAIPPALRGKAFVLEIPVDFLLKDEGR